MTTMTTMQSNPVGAFADAQRLASRSRPLTSDRHRDLLERVAEGDREAREEVVRSNLRLVMSVAHRYKWSNSVDVEDLFQAGVEGLMVAIDRFDVSRGTRLSTYATAYIGQAMQNYVAHHSTAIRRPRSFDQVVRKQRRVASDFYAQHGRQPTDAEVAELMATEKSEFTVEQLHGLREHDRAVQSLDVPMSADDPDTTIIEMIADPAAEDPSALVEEDTEFTEDLMAALEEIPAVERQVVELRLGLGRGGDALSYDEVAEATGKSRDVVRQMEHRALRFLRHRLRNFETMFT